MTENKILEDKISASTVERILAVVGIAEDFAFRQTELKTPQINRI